MPKEHKIVSYEFDELSSKAKEKARDWFREGALDHEWWDSIYEDAKNIGLEITGFDLNNRPYIEARLMTNYLACAKAIVADHGKDCDTYKIATSFLKKMKTAEDTESVGEEFISDLKDAYLKTLTDEAEYIMSEEQVDESIRANEYEFHKDGSRFVVR